jgi:hypothetical protein
MDFAVPADKLNRRRGKLNFKRDKMILHLSGFNGAVPYKRLYLTWYNYGVPHYPSLISLAPHMGPDCLGIICEHFLDFWLTHLWTTDFPSGNGFHFMCICHLLPLYWARYKLSYTICL